MGSLDCIGDSPAWPYDCPGGVWQACALVSWRSSHSKWAAIDAERRARMAASSPAERLESGGVAGWLAVECMDEVASAEHATWVNMSKSRMGLPEGSSRIPRGG